MFNRPTCVFKGNGELRGKAWLSQSREGSKKMPLAVFPPAALPVSSTLSPTGFCWLHSPLWSTGK